MTIHSRIKVRSLLFILIVSAVAVLAGCSRKAEESADDSENRERGVLSEYVNSPLEKARGLKKDLDEREEERRRDIEDLN